MGIENLAIDSTKLVDFPITVHFDFTKKGACKADVLYFDPVLCPTYLENPLKSQERKYPVEMPYSSDEVYNLNMDIPGLFAVDETPKSERVVLNDEDGFYEYTVEKDESSLHLHARTKLNKATFPPEDYPVLRDFFAHIIKKQGEQIVFKKKN
jgi:hypothetical protein